MHQIFTVIGQIIQWSMATPAHQQITRSLIFGVNNAYRNLSPETKSKVDSLVLQGCGMLTKLVLGDAVDWAGTQAISQGLNSQAVSMVQAGVKRASEIGVDAAMKEIHNS